MQFIEYDSTHTQAWHPSEGLDAVVAQVGMAELTIPENLLDFVDQDSYLRWVASWKSQYNALTDEQVFIRQLLSTSQTDPRTMARAQRLKVRYRRMLTALIEVRHAAKRRVPFLRQVAA